MVPRKVIHEARLTRSWARSSLRDAGKLLRVQHGSTRLSPAFFQRGPLLVRRLRREPQCLLADHSAEAGLFVAQQGPPSLRVKRRSPRGPTPRAVGAERYSCSLSSRARLLAQLGLRHFGVLPRRFMRRPEAGECGPLRKQCEAAPRPSTIRLQGPRRTPASHLCLPHAHTCASWGP